MAPCRTALDRTAAVEDRDRKQEFTSCVMWPQVPRTEPGQQIFSGSSKTIEPTKYQIAVRSRGDITVLILGAKGGPEFANAQRIVSDC